LGFWSLGLRTNAQRPTPKRQHQKKTMLTIIDRYILKRYWPLSFAAMLLMFIPIGIIIDVSEKVK
jgi:hypothetical protein